MTPQKGVEGGAVRPSSVFGSGGWNGGREGNGKSYRGRCVGTMRGREVRVGWTLEKTVEIGGGRWRRDEEKRGSILVETMCGRVVVGVKCRLALGGKG